MAKTGDVQFTTAGSTDYNYMLAQDKEGNKRWTVEKQHNPPPSVILDKITMTISVAARMRQQTSSTIITTRDIATVLAELRILADETSDITLIGFDAQTYYVLFDPTACVANSILDETGRITHYHVDLICWNRDQV
jgi:hypothetical protein